MLTNGQLGALSTFGKRYCAPTPSPYGYGTEYKGSANEAELHAVLEVLSVQLLPVPNAEANHAPHVPLRWATAHQLHALATCCPAAELKSMQWSASAAAKTRPLFR